jgi:hypothetical protein
MRLKEAISAAVTVSVAADFAMDELRKDDGRDPRTLYAEDIALVNEWLSAAIEQLERARTMVLRWRLP